MSDQEEADKRRAYHREWSTKNPEKRKGYIAKYRAKHRARILEAERARRRRDVEKRRAASAEYRAKNRDRIRAYSRQYYEQNREKHSQGRRRSHLKKKYAMTEQQFAQMFLEQGGRCAVCGDVPPQGRRLHVDHDHDTGDVRELLCYGCNSGLGSFKDDATRIERALAYLRRHAAKEV